MKLLYITRTVDAASPVRAVQVKWIAELARRPEIERLTVLTGKLGVADLPMNVDVVTFTARPRWRWVPTFMHAAHSIRAHEYDAALIIQGGPYPALMLPYKWLSGMTIAQWKAHPHISPRMRFYARWCDDLLFTATPSSLPINLPDTKLKIIGHGIDVEAFEGHHSVPANNEGRDLLVLGRLSPAKRLERVISIVEAVRDKTGIAPTVDFVGPVFESNFAYVSACKDLVKGLGLEQSVRFLGPVDWADVPSLLNNYKASMNVSLTAFDKSAGESMAARVPVLSSNKNTVEVLSPNLRKHLSLHHDDDQAAADQVAAFLSMSDHDRAKLGDECWELIKENHSISTMAERIVSLLILHRT